MLIEVAVLIPETVIALDVTAVLSGELVAAVKLNVSGVVSGKTVVTEKVAAIPLMVRTA